jgi:hypothetical protein
MNLLKVTTTGGDAAPPVTVSPTGQLDLSGLNVGDTVVFAPGSMRPVTRSPTVEIVLQESKQTTDAELKRQLSINHGEAARIEVMKGQLQHGDVFERVIPINLDANDPNQYDIDLTLLAFNRGAKAFRGDLTVYDSLPQELEFLGFGTAAKYSDQTSLKEGVSWMPFIGFVSMGMDNFSRSRETVAMDHDMVDRVHRYTFKQIVLEPGHAVGFVVHTRYRKPTGEELEELRLQATPIERRH